MARTFTQKHYIAAADTIVAAYHSADHIGTRFAPDANGKQRYAVTLGIGKVLNQFVKTFSADSDKFDCNKFHKYIEDRVPFIRSAAWRAPNYVVKARKGERNVRPSDIDRCPNSVECGTFAEDGSMNEPCVRHGGPQ